MNARNVALTIATLFATTLWLAPVQAGTNDFFGSNIGNSSDSAQGGATVGSAAAAGAGANQMSAPPGDYTSDEKRMQKKFRANVKDAERLIAKAEKLIKSEDQKLSKKGKILKEIGEKRLADLKANNPFPEIATSGKKLQ